MNDTPEPTKRLLTEDEAAAVLRRKPASIKRLRLSGALKFIPGRPPMIDAADLDQWIESAKVRKRLEPTLPARANEESARDWALRMKLKPPRKRRKS